MLNLQTQCRPAIESVKKAIKNLITHLRHSWSRSYLEECLAEFRVERIQVRNKLKNHFWKNRLEYLKLRLKQFIFRMFLRNFLLLSHVAKSWRPSLNYSIRKFRRFNNSLYFKCEDVEKGLKQQYIHNKTYNNNENEVKSIKNVLDDSSGSSGSSVFVRRGLKTVSSLIIISLASYIVLFMDNFLYGLIAIIVAVVSVLFITGSWRWWYIFFVTVPRDLKWVIIIYFFTQSSSVHLHEA